MAERVLCELIRACRQARRISQAELGRRMKPPVSQPAIAQMESGASPLNEDTLVKIAEALAISSAELLREGLRRTGL